MTEEEPATYKFGDTREDGYRFWGYRWNDARSKRKETWYAPEVFEKERARTREYNIRVTREGRRRTPEYNERRRAARKGVRFPRREPTGRKAVRVYDRAKRRAQARLQYAVSKGRVMRPSCCDSCGRESVHIDGHHHRGYDNPLDVQWLCRPCHQRAHRGVATQGSLKSLRGADR